MVDELSDEESKFWESELLNSMASWMDSYISTQINDALDEESINQIRLEVMKMRNKEK